MFYLENESQRDGAQHLQWCHSMVNIELCKNLHIFTLAFTILEISAFQMSDLKNLGKGRGVLTFAMTPVDDDSTSIKGLQRFFTLALTVFEILAFQTFDL